MAGSSLFALIDDIASLLDDVSILTKVAAKKTAGVLGDDLALNAQQVAGVQADRELPVVWAVAKGSLLNKAILVPAALAISAVMPSLIVPLLMIGGAFLCFEGVEKLLHAWLHRRDEDVARHEAMVRAVVDTAIDMVAFERDKIKGAIRTDFILSAEIIVITLGTVADQMFGKQVGVLVGVSLLMTVGVYGLVAGIVKLDDAGLYLFQRTGDSVWNRFQRAVGSVFLRGAPLLMKFLSIAGTAAMFLVGGGILSHNVGVLHHAQQAISGATGNTLGWLVSMGFDALVGIIAGALVLFGVKVITRLRGKSAH
jgi:predicted DNA repair protein MutK